MKWAPYKLRDGSNAQNTICSERGYAILRCTVDGRATGRFIAFYVEANGSRHVLGGYASKEDARQACEAHLAHRTEVAA